VAVSPNGDYAYVSNTNSVIVTTSPPTTATLPATPPSCPNQGTISGFSVSSSGALTTIAGSPFAAGTTPTGIAVDQTSRFLYTTDSVQNQLIVYTINAGALVPNVNGPFSTGIFPVNLVVDPRDQYLYVSNFNDKSISEFTISQVNGQPSALASSTFSSGDAGPTCILVDPALGRYLYVSDSLDIYVQAAELSPNTGALTGVQNAPYKTTGRPTCVAAVPHGNHATQIVPVTAGQ
jgi:DNA-binding beta-propeller fold protein YncE